MSLVSVAVIVYCIDALGIVCQISDLLTVNIVRNDFLTTSVILAVTEGGLRPWVLYTWKRQCSSTQTHTGICKHTPK